MLLKILQTGEPVLRRKARALTREEVQGPAVQQLIRLMRETMRDAPGVGLAGPQVGLDLQLAVIEDPGEYRANIPAERRAEHEREPVAFHVIINPVITSYGDQTTEFFEGCLSVAGFAALVPRAAWVRVECWNETAEPVAIEARGWYARILQHEIDHLNGTLYLDRMWPRSFTTIQSATRYWDAKSSADVRAELAAS